MKARPSVPVGNAQDHVHSPASFCMADTGPRVARSSDPAPCGPRLTGKLRTEDPPRPLLPLQGNFSFDAPLFPGPPGAQCGSAALCCPGLSVLSLGPCARPWPLCLLAVSAPSDSPPWPQTLLLRGATPAGTSLPQPCGPAPLLRGPRLAQPPQENVSFMEASRGWSGADSSLQRPKKLGL